MGDRAITGDTNHEQMGRGSEGDRVCLWGMEGKTVKAARNRVPPKLAEQVGQCMKRAYARTSSG